MVDKELLSYSATSAHHIVDPEFASCRQMLDGKALDFAECRLEFLKAKPVLYAIIGDEPQIGMVIVHPSLRVDIGSPSWWEDNLQGD